MPWLLGKLTKLKQRILRKRRSAEKEEQEQEQEEAPRPRPPLLCAPAPKEGSRKGRKTLDTSAKTARTSKTAKTIKAAKATRSDTNVQLDKSRTLKTARTDVSVSKSRSRSVTKGSGETDSDMSLRLRRLKSFISRPIKEKTMQKIVERIKRRDEERAKPSLSTRRLSESEDAFPTEAFHTKNLHIAKIARSSADDSGSHSRSRSKNKKLKGNGRLSSHGLGKRGNSNKQIERLFADPKSMPRQPIRSSYHAITPVDKSDSDSSKRSVLLVHGNKNNDGRMFIGGRPWWQEKRKPEQEDLEDVTVDDLQLDADVVIEVSDGRVVLEEMPNKRISLDPYQELETLMERDDLFFCQQILFGNTVRTMCNTFTDDGSSKKSKSKRKKGKKRSRSSQESSLRFRLPGKKDARVYKRKWGSI